MDGGVSPEDQCGPGALFDADESAVEEVLVVGKRSGWIEVERSAFRQPQCVCGSAGGIVPRPGDVRVSGAAAEDPVCGVLDAAAGDWRSDESESRRGAERGEKGNEG